MLRVNSFTHSVRTNPVLLVAFETAEEMLWCHHSNETSSSVFSQNFHKVLLVLPYKRLMGMCRWMGSHFHEWIDYNGVVFSRELLEWARAFSVLHIYG